MFDDLELVRDNAQLMQLFRHYATLGESSQENWQIRVMQMEGISSADLVKCHGELIALDWVEQNTGQTPCCYRITLAGLRAFRELQREVIASPEVVGESRAA